MRPGHELELDGLRRWRSVRWVMKKELFNELLQSLQEAAAIERGTLKPSRQFEVKTANDVVRVRQKLSLPQVKFAQLLGISEDTLQN